MLAYLFATNDKLKSGKFIYDLNGIVNINTEEKDPISKIGFRACGLILDALLYSDGENLYTVEQDGEYYTKDSFIRSESINIIKKENINNKLLDLFDYLVTSIKEFIPDNYDPFNVEKLNIIQKMAGRTAWYYQKRNQNLHDNLCLAIDSYLLCITFNNLKIIRHNELDKDGVDRYNQTYNISRLELEKKIC